MTRIKLESPSSACQYSPFAAAVSNHNFTAQSSTTTSSTPTAFPSPMTPSKRRPRCRTCGSMMAGHKRRDGYPVCPDPHATSSTSSSPAPSPSARASPRRAITAPSGPAGIDDIEIPPYGLWHRRNPNWIDPPRAPSTPPEGSVISTVLNSDACSVAKLEDGDTDIDEFETENDEWRRRRGTRAGGGGGGDGRRGVVDDRPSVLSFDSSATHTSGSFIGHVLRTSVPLASLFATPREDIPHVHKAARKRGLHVGLVHSPYGSPSASSPSPSRKPCKGDPSDANTERLLKDGIRRESSWWMVMGKSSEAVRHLIDLQQRGMPGVFTTTTMTENGETREQRVCFAMGFFQLALAGAFGGLVVVYGLSLL